MANQGGNNNPAGPGNIQRLEITPNEGGSGQAADIGPGVVDLRYYESVLANQITATAVVIETGNDESGAAEGILDSLPVRGGEATNLVIEDTRGEKIELELFVNRIRDADSGTQQDMYFLDFVPEEHFNNNQYGVIKRYQGKISDNVQTILSEVLQTENIAEIEETSEEYNFFGNSRKPYFVITNLASKSIPADKEPGTVAGFLFYMTRDGFYFKSIDSFFKKEPVKKLIYNNTGEIPQGFDSVILTYTIGSDNDMNLNLNIGTYKNNSTYFDFYKMEYKEVPFSIEDQEETADTAGKDYITANKQFFQEPTRTFTFLKDMGVNTKGTGDEQLENFKSEEEQKENYKVEQTQVQTVMRYNQMFSVQTKVMIPGDFSIRAGDIIECTFPQIKSDKAKEDNQQSGGKYMVASICHYMTSQETYTSMDLVRDSFGKSGGF